MREEKCGNLGLLPDDQHVHLVVKPGERSNLNKAIGGSGDTILNYATLL